MKQTININSNIRLSYIPMQKLKTTTIGVYIHRELNENDASMNALLPYVLKRGCRKYTSQSEIEKHLESLYGATMGTAAIKRGDDQIIYFDAETISDKYAPEKEKLVSELLSLILSVIFEPLAENGEFSAEIVEQEKKNAKERIQSLMNDKRTYASLRCTEEMCKGESFAISRLGTIEGIDKITPRSLYEHYSRIITSSVIDIYICGDADTAAVEETIKKFISDMRFEKAQITKTEILKKSTGKTDVTDRMDVTQGKLAIGFRTNTKPEDKEYEALTVMNAIFGGGASSKLFNNVREKLSLAYYASSQLERYKGLLIVNAGIEFENFQKAYNETMAQLESIKNGDISDYEFDSSIIALVNSLQTIYDDQRSMQNFCLGAEIAGVSDDIEARKKAIRAVTKEDVAAAARKLELDTVYFLTGKGEE